MVQVVILAGGSINDKLGFLRSRCSCPALIPVNTRPLAAYLIEFYADKEELQVHLVVNATVADTVQKELGTMEGRYELKALEESSGVVHSLAQAIQDFSDDDEVIVNLVTTVPTRFAQTDEVLVADQASCTGKWSGIVLGSEEPVFAFKSSQTPRSSHAFTGVFRCARAVLAAAVNSTDQTNDLLRVIEQLQALRPLRYKTCDWIDCGHEINYYEAKTKLISSRSFNRVQVTLENGVLRKSSHDQAKLKRETDFIQMLPASIEVFFPRVLSRGCDFVESEYYGYPTVSEYFLYWELSPDNWCRMFSRFRSVLKNFTAFSYSISQFAHSEFYLNKTMQRVEAFLGGLEPSLRKTLSSEIVVNGQICRSLSAITDELQKRIACMYKDRDFCIMHGDFCFSNILYDVPSGVVRLIDPRGSFGDQCIGIYGDQKYDLAKLKHSAEYGYDFMVNGLFSMNQRGQNFDYALAQRECSSLVAGLSREMTVDLGHNNDEIDLITSLLFLSMCPLHAEDIRRQLTMYAHGLRMLNTCIEN